MSRPDEPELVDLATLGPSAETLPEEAAQWIDALATVLAVGVRVGERGLHRGGMIVANDQSPPIALAPDRDAEVLDADQVAAFLGVDRKTVYEYAGRGEIPHRRLGKRLLFSRSALVAWLGACKAASRTNGA